MLQKCDRATQVNPNLLRRINRMKNKMEIAEVEDRKCECKAKKLELKVSKFEAEVSKKKMR